MNFGRLCGPCHNFRIKLFYSILKYYIHGSMHFHSWIASLTVAIVMASQSAAAANFVVKVTGLRSSRGYVHIALYNIPKDYPKGDAMMTRIVPAAKPGGISASFSGLAPGTYAFAVYHDENGDNDFNRGFLGIPLEGYAFSNEATVFLGPPSFEEAAVKLNGPSDEIDIVMSY